MSATKASRCVRQPPRDGALRELRGLVAFLNTARAWRPQQLCTSSSTNSIFPFSWGGFRVRPVVGQSGEGDAAWWRRGSVVATRQHCGRRGVATPAIQPRCPRRSDTTAWPSNQRMQCSLDPILSTRSVVEKIEREAARVETGRETPGISVEIKQMHRVWRVSPFRLSGASKPRIQEPSRINGCP